MKKKEFTKKETSDPLDKPTSGDVDEDKGKDMDIFQKLLQKFSIASTGFRKFSGSTGENAYEWYSQFSILEDQIPPGKLLELIRINLIKDAELWYRSLEGEEINNLESFKLYFNEEYVILQSKESQENFWKSIFKGPGNDSLLNFVRKLKIETRSNKLALDVVIEKISKYFYNFNKEKLTACNNWLAIMELAKDNDKEKWRRNNSMMKIRIDDNKERKQDEVKKKKIICAKCVFIGHGIKDCRVKPDNYKVNKVEKNRKESFCCVQGNLKSLVPKVKVKVFDRTCIALIDTGATHVIVSRNLVANKMNKAKEVKELISTMVGKLRSIGLIEIALTIGNSTTCCDALIVDQSPYELILCMNLLKNYKLQVSNDGIWLDNFKLSEGDINPSNESKFLSLHAEAVETKNLLSNMTDEGKLNKFDNNYLGLLKARFQDVFDSSYKPSKIKLDPVIAVHENSKPLFKNVFKRNPKEEQSISQAVKNLLDLGIIEECFSPWSTNPFLVSKKDTDEKRMVIDYRDLNSITISKKFAIPRIDLTLDALSGAAVFTSLDLISGYHQFILDETDRDKTAFSCSSGQYRYKVLPMGLVNAPYIFQRVMTKLFKEYINVFVVVYLDDILVYSKDEESHFKHLNLVLEIIKEYGLTINL
ncbi:YI31B [Hepatospora eriocheir]|uniref:YI31B n=1 Tax=Hepatospora eriocheir TaxID=1081669 RepID=A0A1X0Q791_9MICR|nr:YI31B [Hepatospora eriocheir]